MNLEQIAAWLDKTLSVGSFDDVSNNGVQVARRDATADVTRVAFAVDASVRAVRAAAAAGAQLLFVHHGLSWGGGIRRLTGGVYEAVRAAMDADLALYACHLPLDAHPTLGNNAQLAKLLGLKGVRPAFSCHGRAIGLVGEWPPRAKGRARAPADAIDRRIRETVLRLGAGARRLGVCSGGAGEFAEEARRLGCDLYVTGEASWGDVVAAENCGLKMLCLGHYETETGGVRAVAAAMRRALGVETCSLRLHA